MSYSLYHMHVNCDSYSLLAYRVNDNILSTIHERIYFYLFQ